MKPCRVCQEPTESPDQLCSSFCRQETFNEHPDYEDERHPSEPDDDDDDETEED